ncbi:DNA-binding protein [Kocuria flava]|uniref:DNA-binding protein n=1 Tax=Kocuria flava TaxID=446860 RepID=UPI003F1D6757
MSTTAATQLGEKPITAVELAEWLGTTVDNVAQMRFRGIGPKFVKAGRRVYYMPSAVREWVEANTRSISDS